MADSRGHWLTAIVLLAGSALLATVVARTALQGPAIIDVNENVLREYAGVYSWQDGGFLSLQMWDEFSGFEKPKQLVAFDESGDVRALYPTDRDRFFTGPGAAVATSVESRIAFQRDDAGRIASFTWTREGANPRSARRMVAETHEEVRFSNGDVRLGGTLIRPRRASRVPAVILVHGSGPEDREYSSAVGAVPRSTRHGGPRVRQARRRRFDGSLESGFVRGSGRRRRCGIQLPADPPGHRPRGCRPDGNQPSRVGDADCCRPCAGGRVSHQHLRRRCDTGGDHTRSGEEQDDGERYAGASCGADHRPDEAEVPSSREPDTAGSRTRPRGKKWRRGWAGRRRPRFTLRRTTIIGASCAGRTSSIRRRPCGS